MLAYLARIFFGPPVVPSHQPLAGLLGSYEERSNEESVCPGDESPAFLAKFLKGVPGFGICFRGGVSAGTGGHGDEVRESGGAAVGLGDGKGSGAEGVGRMKFRFVCKWHVSPQCQGEFGEARIAGSHGMCPACGEHWRFRLQELSAEQREKQSNKQKGKS